MLALEVRECKNTKMSQESWEVKAWTDHQRRSAVLPHPALDSLMAFNSGSFDTSQTKLEVAYFVIETGFHETR